MPVFSWEKGGLRAKVARGFTRPFQGSADRKSLKTKLGKVVAKFRKVTGDKTATKKQQGDTCHKDHNDAMADVKQISDEGKPENRNEPPSDAGHVAREQCSQSQAPGTGAGVGQTPEKQCSFSSQNQTDTTADVETTVGDQRHSSQHDVPGIEQTSDDMSSPERNASAPDVEQAIEEHCRPAQHDTAPDVELQMTKEQCLHERDAPEPDAQHTGGEQCHTVHDKVASPPPIQNGGGRPGDRHRNKPKPRPEPDGKQLAEGAQCLQGRCRCQDQNGPPPDVGQAAEERRSQEGQAKDFSTSGDGQDAFKRRGRRRGGKNRKPKSRSGPDTKQPVEGAPCLQGQCQDQNQTGSAPDVEKTADEQRPKDNQIQDSASGVKHVGKNRRGRRRGGKGHGPKANKAKDPASVPQEAKTQKAVVPKDKARRAGNPSGKSESSKGANYKREKGNHT